MFTARSPRSTCLALVLAVTSAVTAPSAAAQSSESPVPFDSTGKVPVVTPSLAERLKLDTLAWPVRGEFDRVRLYATNSGDYVLVAERGNGTLERWPLARAEGDALRARVASSLRESTQGVGAQTAVLSEPAGNAFVRTQAALGTALYGPAAATMVASDEDDGSIAGAAYLMVAGGTFFAAMARRHASPEITTAQNDLSSWGALHGAALGGATAYITNVESRQAAAGMVLAGSVGGTLLGLGFGRDMTDAESAASSFAATSAALTTLGLAGTIGLLEEEENSSSRASVGLASAALVSGHVLGPRYPRRAGYVVTAGDVESLWVPATIGALAGLVPFVDQEDGDASVVFGAVTAGYVGGIIVGDRFLARPFDHSKSDAILLSTGATAGALMSWGMMTLSDATDGSLQLGAVVAGAAAGTAFTESLLRASPRRQQEGALRAPPGKEKRVGVTVDPMGVVFAAARRPGRFSLVRMTF